jgi:hypothetical protein
MSFLRKLGSLLKDRWMRFARGVAIVNTAILLTLFYLVIIGPISLFIRIVGKDFLQMRSIDTAKRQF